MKEKFKRLFAMLRSAVVVKTIGLWGWRIVNALFFWRSLYVGVTTLVRNSWIGMIFPHIFYGTEKLAPAWFAISAMLAFANMTLWEFLSQMCAEKEIPQKREAMFKEHMTTCITVMLGSAVLRLLLKGTTWQFFFTVVAIISSYAESSMVLAHK